MDLFLFIKRWSLATLFIERRRMENIKIHSNLTWIEEVNKDTVVADFTEDPAQNGAK